MAVAFRSSSSTNTAGATTLAANLPTGVTTGDIRLMCVTAYANTTIAITTNGTGWTQIGSTQAWFGSARSTAVFWKEVTTSSDPNPTVTFGTSCAASIVTEGWMGADTTTPIDTYAFSNDSDTSSANIPAPALTTTHNARVVVFAHADSAITPPTNFIERVEVTTNARCSANDIGPDYAAGSIGGWTATSTAGLHAAWSIALKEDAARKEPAWESTGTVGSSTGGITATPSTPASIQNDELMLLIVSLESPTVTVSTVPSGWNLIDSTLSGQVRIYSYWKVYDGTIGQFGFSATAVNRLTNSRFTSPHPTTPVDASAEDSGLASTAVNIPSVTPGVDGLRCYQVGTATTANQANSAAPGSSLTERSDASTAGASGSTSVNVGTGGPVSAGVASSASSVTMTNAHDWAAQTIVLASLPSAPAAPTGLTATLIAE